MGGGLYLRGNIVMGWNRAQRNSSGGFSLSADKESRNKAQPRFP